MRRDYIMSEKLQSQIEAFNNLPLVPGDKVMIKGKYLRCSSSRNGEMEQLCSIKNVTEDGIIVYNGYQWGDTHFVANGNYHKDTRHVGANPFTKEEWKARIRTLNMDLEGIILMLLKPLRESESHEKRSDGTEYKISLLNWNPYIINKDGEKEYYQRDFCWSTKDKQCLIDSIYNRINCGQILVRKHSHRYMVNEANNGADEVFEFDIVDGKQRLSAIWGFMNNEFPDTFGNYWNDLSEAARTEFERSMVLTYAEMEENTTDEDTIKAFLGVNFTGVPMSPEHIEYIKGINKRL